MGSDRISKEGGSAGSVLLVCHAAVLVVPGLDIGDGLLIQRIGTVWEVVLKRGKAVLTHHVIHQFAGIWLRRIQLEGVLALGDAAGIVAIELPVTTLHSLLHLGLGTTHTSLDVLLQAGAVGNDDGGAGILLRLADGLEGLGLVVADGNLSNVDIAIVHQDAALE